MKAINQSTAKVVVVVVSIAAYGAIAARRSGRVIDGRATALRHVVKHLATHHVITAQLRRCVVDFATSAALPLVSNRRRTTARRADAGVSTADMSSTVVDSSPAARPVVGESLMDRSLTAHVSAVVVRARRAGSAVDAALPVVDVLRAAVDGRPVNPRTQSRVRAADLFSVVVDSRAAAGCVFTMNSASDHSPTATQLICKYTPTATIPH